MPDRMSSAAPRPNQNSEQVARDRIDAQLRAAGWAVQDNDAIDFKEGEGQAVREYTTDCGPADYVLFVDTRNLGEQAEQEFLAYQPSDDNRKFTELYTVQRLNSFHVPKDAEVCISTIQRMYSILHGEIYVIETEITQNGGTVLKGLVEKREKLTRASPSPWT